MKKILALVLALALCLSCASALAAKVGVSMPTKDLQRWNQDGAYMEEKLAEAGFEPNVQYAGNDVNTQISQIETMINDGCEVIVIAAIEGSSLGAVLDKAAEKGIKVIAYDRLIMDNGNVDYYATFDNYKVGTVQGTYIKEKLDLDNATGPIYMEITAGDPGDNNARYFYQGALDVLKPYIDSGVIVVPSGQIEFDQVATPTWKTEVAQQRAEDILTTGQDCDIANTKNMIAGKQSMSVFKDTRTLAAQVVKMVGQILAGEAVDVNDTETYNNNVKVVPSFLCDPVFADANNYKEILIDSGYYTEDQLQ